MTEVAFRICQAQRSFVVPEFGTCQRSRLVFIMLNDHSLFPRLERDRARPRRAFVRFDDPSSFRSRMERDRSRVPHLPGSTAIRCPSEFVATVVASRIDQDRRLFVVLEFLGATDSRLVAAPSATTAWRDILLRRAVVADGASEGFLGIGNRWLRRLDVVRDLQVRILAAVDVVPRSCTCTNSLKITIVRCETTKTQIFIPPRSNSLPTLREGSNLAELR